MKFCCYIVKHIFNGLHVRTPCWYTRFLAPFMYMALFVFLPFCDGSPSWRKILPFGLLVFSKASLKCFCMKSAKIIHWFFQNTTHIRLLIYHIVTIKSAVLSPLPGWLPFAVQSGSKPVLHCRQLMVLTDMALSKGLYLCWYPTLSKYNDIPSVQIFFLNTPLIFLENFSFKPFGSNNPFFLEWRNLYPLFLNRFITISSKTLLPIPETNHSLLIANDLNSSLNLRVSCKTILSSISNTFFGLPLLHLRLSTTSVESIDLTALIWQHVNLDDKRGRIYFSFLVSFLLQFN